MAAPFADLGTIDDTKLNRLTGGNVDSMGDVQDFISFKVPTAGDYLIHVAGAVGSGVSFAASMFGCPGFGGSSQPVLLNLSAGSTVCILVTTIIGTPQAYEVRILKQ